MKNFLSIFIFEFKRFLGKWYLIALGVIFILMMYYSITGINEYKSLSEKEIKFKEIQSNYFKTAPNYVCYGRDGIKSMFISSPAGIFFRNAVIQHDLSSKIDSIVCLNLYNNIKGKTLNPGNLIYNMDFSGIVLFVIAIFALYHGYECIRSKEFKKFISSIMPYKFVFFTTIISRFTLFAMAFCILFFSQILFIKIHEIDLSSTDFSRLLEYLLTTLLMLLFFFFIGFIIGTFRLKGFSNSFSMFAVWFSFIFIIPGVINSIIEKNNPDAIKDYKTELDKFKIAMDFEKKTENVYGKFDRNNIEVERKIIEGYWNNYYKKIEEVEEKLKNEFYSNINSYNKIAIFTPVTFYLLTSNEVSSKGYKNFFMFYTNQQELKKNFVRFFIDRTFYNDPKVMVNFIKKNENLFYAKSQLPENFGTGVMINMAYIIGLFFLSYFRFKRAMFPLLKKEKISDDANIELEKGKVITFNCHYPDFTQQFLNGLYGESKKFTGKISIDGDNIATMDKKDFFCLPHPDNIPDDIKAGDLLSLFKKSLNLNNDEFLNLKTKAGKDILDKQFGDLKKFEQANIMISIAELGKWKVYIFNDFPFGLSEDLEESMVSRVDKLRNKETMIIEISSTSYFWLQGDFSIIVLLKNNMYKVIKRDWKDKTDKTI